MEHWLSAANEEINCFRIVNSRLSQFPIIIRETEWAEIVHSVRVFVSCMRKQFQKDAYATKSLLIGLFFLYFDGVVVVF